MLALIFCFLSLLSCFFSALLTCESCQVEQAMILGFRLQVQQFQAGQVARTPRKPKRTEGLNVQIAAQLAGGWCLRLKT